MNNQIKVLGFALLLFCITLPCFGTALTDPLTPVGPAPAISARAAVLMDAETGTVLYSHNPGMVISPASLTKLMTIHLAMRSIKAGKASANDIVALPPETWAENQPPRSSLMFLARNQIVTLGELLLGLAIASGNDAAVAVALHICPTLEAFIAMMNAEAGRLGLISTHFVEPAGISAQNTSSAIDLAHFCRTYVKEHPDCLALLHSVPSFAYPLPINTGGGPTRTILQYNRNNLIGQVEGVDGLKTGFINDAGYNIALTGNRRDTRLVAVLMGSATEETRDRDGQALLEWGFANFKTLRPVAELLPETRIWGSKEKYYPLTLAEDLTFTVSTNRGVLVRDIEITPYLKAPLKAGDQCGVLLLSDSMGAMRSIPLVLTKDAQRGNFFKVLFDGIALIFTKMFKMN